jgi:outer membrane immunogenic protein
VGASVSLGIVFSSTGPAGAAFAGECAAWTAPAGALTVKVEYLHADFGTGLFINPPVVVGTTTINSRNVKLTDDIVRAGVNWKFNWW